jgi:Zn-dependent protease with chaperone function
MDPVLALEAGRLLAHGGEFTADEFGKLALLSLPVLALFIAFVVVAELRRQRGTRADDSAAARRSMTAGTVGGGGSDADPS